MPSEALLALCLIDGICSFTITFLMRYTEGPFDIFAHFRRFVRMEIPIILHDHNGEPVIAGWAEDEEPELFFAKLVYCFWCFTAWISFLVSLFVFITFNLDNILLFPLLWFFATGVSGILNSVLR